MTASLMIALILSWSASVFAETPVSTPSSTPVPMPSPAAIEPAPTAAAQPKKIQSVFRFAFDASVFNSYSRGNLDDWFQSAVSDNSKNVDAGSASFFQLDLAWIATSENRTVDFGVGLGLMLPASRALWGTNLVFGGRDELALKPFVMSLPFIFRSTPEDGKISYYFAPALAFGWVTGEYDDATGSDLTFVAAPKLGFIGTVGLEYFFSKGMGLSLKLGYRLLSPALIITDATSSTGQSQMTVNGQPVNANLSGSFGTLGLVLELQ